MMRRRYLVAAGVAGLVGCGSLATTIASPLPRLVWNASASAPIGLYRVEPGVPVHAGDMVVARLPVAFRRLADRRHYLPLGVPLVKRVAATAGATVCAHGRTITIDSRAVVDRLSRDRLGRPLPAWQGCRTLGPGQLLLLMPTVRESLDSRYFGPVERGDVIGKAMPLWLQ